MNDDDDLLTVLLRRPAWHADALCREYRHLNWFPERGTSTAELRAVCARCSVQAECLADALARGVVGFWAGTTTRERRRQARAARAA